jgi:hypothetical protein
MSIKHNAAVIAVATFVFGSYTTMAATSHGCMSGTAADAGDDSSDRSVATVGSSRKGDAAQQPGATFTPDPKVDQPDNAVREGRAVMTKLGANASATTYWVNESDGWHVVTTVDIGFDRDTDAEKQSVVRFSAVLLPGQSQRISVPSAIGERQQVLCVRRLGDRLEVVRVFGSSV